MRLHLGHRYPVCTTVLLSRGGEAGVGEAGKDTEDWFQGGSGNELLTQTGPLTLGKMSNSQVHEESTVET